MTNCSGHRRERDRSRRIVGDAALVAIAGLIPLGAGGYFAMALALRLDGLDEIRALVKRLRDRFRGVNPGAGD